MKKTLSLVFAFILVLAVFSGCARKAEPHTVDSVKIKSVVYTQTNKEIDKEAFAKAFNEAITGNIVRNDDYKSKSPVLVVTTDGVLTLFETKENSFVVHYDEFGDAYEIESAELHNICIGE